MDMWPELRNKYKYITIGFLKKTFINRNKSW